MGAASADSTAADQKYSGKKIIPALNMFLVIIPKTIQCDIYLPSSYIEFGIIGNLEMTFKNMAGCASVIYKYRTFLDKGHKHGCSME